MGTLSLRPPPFRRFLNVETLTLISPLSRNNFCSPPPLLQWISLKSRLSTTSAGGTQCTTSGSVDPPAVKSFPIAEETLMGFITGKRKATEVAHSVWKNFIQKGDTVVDATCGNGHDTVALLTMIADESGRGCVYGMDIQNSALESTSSLLEISVGKNERKLVKLFSLCHTKMEDIVPKDTAVRLKRENNVFPLEDEKCCSTSLWSDLVNQWECPWRSPVWGEPRKSVSTLIAFNLGYLPGGDKAITTMPQTTLIALQAASRILMSGGLISMVVYVGHPGGRDELESVQLFASRLPAETWVSCKFEVLNRPTGPILVLLFKK